MFISTPINFSTVPTPPRGLCQNIINVTLWGKKLMGFICSLHLTNMCTNYQLTPDGCVLCLNRHNFFFPPITSTQLPWQQIHGNSSSCTVSLEERIYLTPPHFKVISPHYVCNYKDKISPKMMFTQLARLLCHILY